MKIVFNTRYPNAVASILYREALSGLDNIDFFKRDKYEEYDVALFMSYTKDLDELGKVRDTNNKIKIGIIDPRGEIHRKYLSNFDFIIVDSIEMKDFFSQYRKPIFTYYEYQPLKRITKKHINKTPIIISYHGNKVHLESMFPRITTALDLLSEKYALEFWAMYNIEKLGRWEVGLPQKIPVKHIQWSENNYYDYLAEADIGIVPCFMPIKNINKLKRNSIISKQHFLDTKDDYLLKFKVPTNAGRLIVFSLLGLPVVADMVPSATQFIEDGVSGFLAYNTGGWYLALESLIKSAALRNKLSINNYTRIQSVIDYDNQNKRFKVFLDDVIKISREKDNNSIPTIHPTIDIVKSFYFKYKSVYRISSLIYKKMLYR